jgi:hypothetical protein
LPGLSEKCDHRNDFFRPADAAEGEARSKKSRMLSGAPAIEKDLYQ